MMAELRMVWRELRPILHLLGELLGILLPWLPVFIFAGWLVRSEVWLMSLLSLPADLGFLAGPVIVVAALLWRKMLRG